MLYEVITAGGQRRLDARALGATRGAGQRHLPGRAGALLVAHGRITSYNVCYTKLLRHEEVESMYKVHKIGSREKSSLRPV